MRDRVLDYDEAVLDIVSLIPPGRVLTYGDIAEVLEKGGPRQVGAVMSRGTADVPWWRVLRADGRPPQGMAAAAAEHYRTESTALRIIGRKKQGIPPPQYRVDLARARWNPTLAEQDALQRIRVRLDGGGPDSRDRLLEMSEADDGVEP